MEKNIKDYIKSFGRIPIPPPGRVIKNRKGKGSYRRSRVKKETKRIIREQLQK